MDRRFLLFLLLATLLLWANLQFVRWMNGPQEVAKKDEGGEPPAKTVAEDEQPPKTLTAESTQEKPATGTDNKQHPRRWVTLGSADPDSPYRMLVVLTSRGAGVEWAALNSEDYLDLDALFYKRGYLGYLALTKADSGGAVVNVVGPGSPADKAGLKPRDIITSITGPRDKESTPVNVPADVEEYLSSRSRFGETVQVSVTRGGEKLDVGVPLGKHPLELLKPEGSFDPPLSFLMTLAEVDRTDGSEKDDKEADKKKLAISKETGITWAKATGDGALIDDVRPGSPAAKAGLQEGDTVVQLDKLKIQNPKDFKDAINAHEVPTGAYLDVTYRRGDATGTSTARLALPAELDGVRLYDADWEIIEGNDDTSVAFRKKVHVFGADLEVVKRYTLAKKEGDAPASSSNTEGPQYHLTLAVEIKRASSDGKPLKVAYQIDGPQGLPTEGWWYATKISRTSGTAGARDVVYNLDGEPKMYNCPELGHGNKFAVAQPASGEFRFASVDGRYFAVAMKPQAADGSSPSLQMLQPLVVGPVDERRLPLTNTSFRLITGSVELKDDQPLKHSYTVFLGPKQRSVLALPEYELTELIYYGWPIFAVVADLMVRILSFFYWLIPNYGVAIILLTVLVRLCMFPLSRKQALGAQKMQKLAPELKRLAEKHKNDFEGRAKAQRELFRKHNYNPAAGCLPIFLQLPIFIGLYKGLSLATELRQAPLIPGFYWCSDLSAPDRLFRWDGFMPDFLAGPTGWLGPYFNLLPIITIVLFLVQQKMFMPPPTDDQQRMQQKVMTYMMIFMGFLFFKVPSGLCIYFIASSLWGIAERKLLPKISHETEETPAAAGADARQAVPEKGRPRGAEAPATAAGAAPRGAAAGGTAGGFVQRATGRLGGSALGKLFKNISAAADNQPRTEAGKRRQKKRGKGNK